VATLAGTALAPEVGETVREAQDKLRRAAQVANLNGDPLGAVIEAQAVLLGAQHRMFVDGNLKLGAQIVEAKRPVDPEAVRRAVAQGVADFGGEAVRRMGWRNMVIGAGMLLVTLLLGAGAGYLFRGAVPVLVGVHAGAEKCEDRADGSRLCWIPVFERLPSAKAAAR
jgi:hypothetical protein